MSKNRDLILVQNLLVEVDSFDLYAKLLTQLQKDMDRAGIGFSIRSKLKSNELVHELTELLKNKLQSAFNEYLNLLYAVDVSEKEIMKSNLENIDDIAVHATYLILKREWKKVWYRYHDSNSK